MNIINMLVMIYIKMAFFDDNDNEIANNVRRKVKTLDKIPNLKDRKKNDKVKYLIYMINEMDLTNRLRLAICMSDSSCTNLKYDKPEMYKYFDSLLKEIDEEYRTISINFAKYRLIMFAMAKIMEMTKEEQNQVALYLFNKVKSRTNYCIKLQ